MSKKSILIVFGGSSFEHRISLDSAQTIIEGINRDKYDVSMLGISKAGKCFIGPDSMNILLQESDGYTGSQDLFILKHGENTCKSFIECLESLPHYPDIIFPVIHGFNGEDGRLQGMLDLIGVPYVGSGVSGSAVCMDKLITKAMLEKSNIPQLPYLGFTDIDWQKNADIVMQKVQSLGFPVFIKPANLGSSIGISKVQDQGQLEDAINDALKYDQRILAEKGLEHPREIEVAIIGNHDFQTSVAGELSIDTRHEFYTYEAKYIDYCSVQSHIPAQISETDSQRLQNFAKEACRATNIKGLTRVDFFLDRATGDYFLNELNTVPDFTLDSMFPSLWKASGVPYDVMIDMLVDLALQK